jgi:hypothetical protein
MKSFLQFGYNGQYNSHQNTGSERLRAIKQHKSHAELQTKIAKKYRQKRRTTVVFDPTRILYKSENNPFYSYHRSEVKY